MTTAFIIDKVVNAYFFANMFLTGILFAEIKNEVKSIRDWAYAIIVIFISILFALPIYIIHEIIYMTIKRIIGRINAIFQLSFLFNFHFTKEFDNLEKYKLERIGLICKNKFNKNTIHDKIYRHCALMIFKRNNFTYIHKEIEF